MRKILVIVMAVALCIAATACGDISAEEHNKVVAENGELSTSLKQLAEDFETLTAQYEQAAEKLEEMEERLTATQSELDAAKKDLSTKEGQLQAAEATLNEMTGLDEDALGTKSNLDSLTVYVANPIDGKYHNVGCDYLKNGQGTMELGEAKEEGLQPCTLCGAPE